MIGADTPGTAIDHCNEACETGTLTRAKSRSGYFPDTSVRRNSAEWTGESEDISSHFLTPDVMCYFTCFAELYRNRIDFPNVYA